MIKGAPMLNLVTDRCIFQRSTANDGHLIDSHVIKYIGNAKIKDEAFE